MSVKSFTKKYVPKKISPKREKKLKILPKKIIDFVLHLNFGFQFFHQQQQQTTFLNLIVKANVFVFILNFKFN